MKRIMLLKIVNHRENNENIYRLIHIDRYAKTKKFSQYDIDVYFLSESLTEEI